MDQIGKRALVDEGLGSPVSDVGVYKRRDLADAEFGGEREFALGEVEGEERAGFEGEGRGDMKDVQGTGAENAGLCAGQLLRAVVDGEGHGCDQDEAGPHVSRKESQDALDIRRLHLSTKNRQIQRVDEFEFAEVCGQQARL